MHFHLHQDMLVQMETCVVTLWLWLHDYVREMSVFILQAKPGSAFDWQLLSRLPVVSLQFCLCGEIRTRLVSFPGSLERPCTVTGMLKRIMSSFRVFPDFSFRITHCCVTAYYAFCFFIKAMFSFSVCFVFIRSMFEWRVKDEVGSLTPRCWWSTVHIWAETPVVIWSGMCTEILKQCSHAPMYSESFWSQ